MKTLLLTSVVWIAVSALCVAEERPPNIVFILADDLGYADLGCYGHPYARTPAIDRLAREGTRFTQFYVAGITCSPSRTGFMTGLAPARFQRYPADFGFGGRITITELLHARGYRTGHFGKWHIGPPAAGRYGIDVYSPGSRDRNSERGRDAGLFDDAIRFIEANAADPFYVNIWGHITHYPVDPHRLLAATFEDIHVDRADFSPTMQRKFDQCVEIGGDLDAAMRNYLGDVCSLDQQVARVLETLDELGLTEHTIVVFSSDHGPAPVLLGGRVDRAREHSPNMLGYAGEFRGGKHDQYEGGVRAPFIVRWPGRVPAGRTDDSTVLSGLDWMPTLCRIAGVPSLPEEMDGEDATEAWFGREWTRSEPLFWKTNSRGSSPAMRSGRWKLHLRRRDGTWELYDLSGDPSESRNVADQFPEVVAELTEQLRRWIAELPEDYEKN